MAKQETTQTANPRGTMRLDGELREDEGDLLHELTRLSMEGSISNYLRALVRADAVKRGGAFRTKVERATRPLFAKLQHGGSPNRRRS